MKFNFISEGIKLLHPNLDAEKVKEDPTIAFNVFHPDDIPFVMQSIKTSFENLSEWFVEFRVIQEDNRVEWHAGRAEPEKQADGSVVWYGTFINITNRVDYEKALEQIAFDISHVLRRPVATLLGLTALIEKEEMTKKKIHDYSGYIKKVSEELELFTRKLNNTYCSKREILTGAKR